MCSFYQTRIMPYVIHGGCSMPAFTRMRERVLPKARGLVAEIGFGSGLNLPYYDSAKVDRLIGIDPDPSMLGIARKRLAGIRLQVQLIEGRAEELSLPDSSMDTAVVTYALCTIPNPQSALREIRRILKPGGRLLFIEHGRSATPWRHRWQDRLNGAWGRIAGGCHLNRNPVLLIEDAGFMVDAKLQERFPLHLWQLGTQCGGEASPASLSRAGQDQCFFHGSGSRPVSLPAPRGRSQSLRMQTSFERYPPRLGKPAVMSVSVYSAAAVDDDHGQVAPVQPGKAVA